MAEKYSFIVVKYPQPNTAADALEAVKYLAKEDIPKPRKARSNCTRPKMIPPAKVS